MIPTRARAAVFFSLPRRVIVNNEGELQFELNQNAWKLNNIIEWK